MEGYTARDALIVMRMDLTDSLHELEAELADLEETLEFSGIAEHMRDDETLVAYPAIRRWLDTVGNVDDLRRDHEELLAEREELLTALAHLDERIRGQ